jgi:hypothetical protein
MLRWIAVLLIVALPVRGGLAAMQFCPWMGATAAIAAMGASPTANTAMDMSDECPGAAMPDGQCKLQTACTVTPVLRDATPVNTERILQANPRWSAVYAALVFPLLPERVPIQVS